MNWAKKTALAVLVAGVLIAAFTLSFDAQVRLAIACGVTPALAALYPLVVDAAILTGVLIGVWRPDLTRGLRRYLWGAIAVWTAISVLGNAIHVLALPEGALTVPLPLAIAVNTIPAVTLFLLIHLTSRTIHRAAPAPRPRTKATPGDRTVPAGDRTYRAAARAPREDIPAPTDDELLKLAETMSFAEIGKHIGRSKSYVGKRVLEARRAKENAA